jgi:hypothetical protein
LHVAYVPVVSVSPENSNERKGGQMTNKQINRMGWMTLKDVAKVTGRTSGGGLVRELTRAGVRQNIDKRGVRWWLDLDVVTKIKPRQPAGSVRPESAAFIDREVKRPPELPLGWVGQTAKQAVGEMICAAAKTCGHTEGCRAAKPHKSNALCHVKCRLSGGQSCVPYKPDEKPVEQAATQPAQLDAEAVRSIVRAEIAAAVKKIREALA